jgi:hypothetical protein
LTKSEIEERTNERKNIFTTEARRTQRAVFNPLALVVNRYRHGSENREFLAVTTDIKQLLMRGAQRRNPL